MGRRDNANAILTAVTLAQVVRECAIGDKQEHYFRRVAGQSTPIAMYSADDRGSVSHPTQ